jgi:hypothetical protein
MHRFGPWHADIRLLWVERVGVEYSISPAEARTPISARKLLMGALQSAVDDGKANRWKSGRMLVLAGFGSRRRHWIK